MNSSSVIAQHFLKMIICLDLLAFPEVDRQQRSCNIDGKMILVMARYAIWPTPLDFYIKKTRDYRQAVMIKRRLLVFTFKIGTKKEKKVFIFSFHVPYIILLNK